DAATRGGLRRRRVLLHVLLLRPDRQPAARDQPGPARARDSRRPHGRACAVQGPTQGADRLPAARRAGTRGPIGAVERPGRLASNLALRAPALAGRIWPMLKLVLK